MVSLSTLLEISVITTKVITLTSLLISCPLYIRVLVIIFKRRKHPPFNSQFFIIYIALGIVDIMSYLFFVPRKLVYWQFDLPWVTPYNEPNFVMKILFFLIWWFGHVQFQLTILICFNRFALIALKEFYKRFWTSFSTYAAITVIFTVSFCIAAPIFFLDVMATEYTTTVDGVETLSRVGPVFANVNATKLYYLSWRFHIYGIIATSTVFYIIMFFKIKEIRKLAQNQTSRSEIRLMYPAFVLFVCNCLYVAYFAFRDYLTSIMPNSSRYTEWSIYVMGDLYDLNNVYVILFTSKELRKAALRNFMKKSATGTSVNQGITTVPLPQGRLSVSHR